MSENSNISWTDHTFNPWEGCTKVSPGCSNCYAEARNKRFANGANWGKGAPRRRTSEANWNLPLKWNLQAERELENFKEGVAAGAGMSIPRRPRVFCASLADWLDDEVPIQWLADLLDLIRKTPNLDWLLLSKRPENFHDRISAVYESRRGSDLSWFLRDWLMIFTGNYGGDYEVPANVWIGTTVEDQQRADKRIPLLLEIPAKVRFLSCEPLLEPVKIDHIRKGDNQWFPMQHLHLVIVGGESGPGFRHFDPDWARSLRDQCKAAGVAFHMKQMGGLKPTMMPKIPEDLLIRDFPQP